MPSIFQPHYSFKEIFNTGKDDANISLTERNLHRHNVSPLGHDEVVRQPTNDDANENNNAEKQHLAEIAAAVAKSTTEAVFEIVTSQIGEMQTDALSTVATAVAKATTEAVVRAYMNERKRKLDNTMA